MRPGKVRGGQLNVKKRFARFFPIEMRSARKMLSRQSEQPPCNNRSGRQRGNLNHP
jgi:hypothetical protein